MLALPGVLFPIFIALACVLCLVFRNSTAPFRWRYRDVLTVIFVLVGILCVILAMGRRSTSLTAASSANSEPVIEVDMLVSAGTFAELWVNDWQHPSERVPILAGQRHVYRFTHVPRQIQLIRLDPTEQPGARIDIYGLSVKGGDRIARTFGPEDLKHWTLANLSISQEDHGGLTLFDTNDDPILWSQVSVQVPEVVAPSTVSRLASHWLSLMLLVAALAGLVLIRVARGQFSQLLNAELPSAENGRTASWCALAVALLAGGLAIYVFNQKAAADSGIEVDMFVGRGSVVEFWTNDWTHESERLPVVQGQRHIYRFTKLPQQISLLRLDPTEAKGSRIVLYGIEIKSGGNTLRRFTPEDLKHWTLRDVSASESGDGGLALDSTTDDPLLWNRMAFQFPTNVLLTLAADLLTGPDALFLLLTATFLVILLTRVATPAGRADALLIAVLSCVVYPVVRLVMKLQLLPPPRVSVAVGFDSYTGYAKGNEFLAAAVATVICISLAYAFARFFGPAGNAEDLQDVEEEAVRSGMGRSKGWLAGIALLGLLSLYFLPDVKGSFVSLPAMDRTEAHSTNLELVESLSQVRHESVQWDARNQLTVSYMIHSGLLPFRDFWYTFSGTYLQLLPFPTGPLLLVAHCVLLCWVLCWSLFKITGRRLGQTAVLSSLVLLTLLLSLLMQWDRYLTAVDVALFYVAICGRPFQWRAHLLFGAFAGYAFFVEPTQVLYGSVGIAVEMLVSTLSPFQLSSWRQVLPEILSAFRRRLVRAGVPALAGISAALLFYAVQGMLPGFLAFELSLGDQAVYGGLPSEISHWVLPDLQADTVFLLIFLLAAYGVYRAIRLQGRPDPLGSAVIALCGTAFMVMQKQIMRPHVMTQFRIIPYIATLIFCLIVWRERRPLARLVLAAAVGSVFAMAWHGGAVAEIWHEGVERSPEKITSLLRALGDPRELATRNANLYSRSSWLGFDEENAVVDNLIQSCGLRPEENVFVLGDNSVFYILLNRRPPYLINAFTESPRYEQQKVLDWLVKKDPRFVIWDPAESTFDGVPHTVRIPMLYDYVVQHYEFLHPVGRHHILTKRPPGKPWDLDYWRHSLGTQVDLAHVPSLARLSEYESCEKGSTGCEALYVVNYPDSPNVPAGKLTVDIDDTAGPFKVQFDVAPGEREYVVNLDRLWFWNLLAKSPEPRIAIGPGVNARVDYRRERSPVLY